MMHAKRLAGLTPTVRHLMILAASLLVLAGSFSPASSRTDRYGYDDAGRLVSEKLGDLRITYTYDPAGNLLSRVPEPGAGALALAALGATAWLRRRRSRGRRGARLAGLVAAVTLLGLGSTPAQADCSLVDFPLLPVTVAAPPGGNTTVRVQCSELCTFNNSVSPDPGPFSISPENIQIGPGVPFDFLLLADAAAMDGDESSVFLQYSCPSGGSSFDLEAIVNLLRNATIEKKGGGTDSDPVSTRNGELFQEPAPDLDLGGPLPLRFQRYYASKLLDDGRISSELGDNWLHDFSWELDESSREAVLTTNRGRTVRFVKQGPGWTLVGPSAIAYQLADNDDTNGVTLYDPTTRLFYEFSVGDRLFSVRDRNDNTLTFSFDVPGPGQVFLDTISDDFGRVLQFTYSNGRIASVSDGTRTVLYGYTGSNLTSVTDAAGGVTTYAYDDGALMTSETRPEMNVPFTQTWSTGGGAGIVAPAGRVLTQTDGNGNELRFDYADPVTTMTDDLGGVRHHTHDIEGELTHSTDRSGNGVAIGIDAAGRRGTVTDRNGNTTTTTYDAISGERDGITHADGTTSSLSYTSVTGLAFGELTGRFLDAVHNADGSMESFGYDASGNMTSRTDPEDHTSTATYNGAGQPLTATNAASGVTTMTYDGMGRPDTHTDPNGYGTTFSYDLGGGVSQLSYEDGTSVQIGSNAAGVVTSRTDENGNTTTLGVDENCNPISLADDDGTVTYGYDDNDRVTSRTDREGETASVTYNETGRVGSATNETNHTTSFGYDSAGRLGSVMRPMGQLWLFEYDDEGSLADYTGPTQPAPLHFARDEMGRVTMTTTPRGHTWWMDHDPMGRPNQWQNPQGGITEAGYDLRGLLTRVTLPGGAVEAEYEYDELGNLDTLWDPNDEAWLRDYSNAGFETSRTDPLGQTITIGRDMRNRPITFTYPGALGTLTVTRDDVGNPTALSGTDGTNVWAQYDAANRIVAGTDLDLTRDAEGRVTVSNGIIITRDAAGRIETVQLSPFDLITYTYDANGRVTRVEDTGGGSIDFAYDDRDNVIYVMRSNGTQTDFSYDDDGNCIGIDDGPFGDVWITRDELGRIRNVERSSLGPAPITLNPIFQTFGTGSQVDGVQYDETGHVTQDGAETYSWNLGDRLWSYTRGGMTTDSTYDALGNRSSRTRGDTTLDFVWNYGLAVPGLGIERVDGQDLRYFVYHPDGTILYRIDATTGERTFYHFNETGDTAFTTDDKGAQNGAYLYSAFGRVPSGAEAPDEPFTYRGQFGGYEEAPGLHLIPRFGFYDADRSRYLSRRPMSRSPLFVNPYGFFGGNPVNELPAQPLDTPRAGLPSVPEVVREVREPQVDRREQGVLDGNTLSAIDLGSILLGELEIQRPGPGVQPPPFTAREFISPTFIRFLADLDRFAAGLSGSLPISLIPTNVDASTFPLGPESFVEAAQEPSIEEPKPGKPPSFKPSALGFPF